MLANIPGKYAALSKPHVGHKRRLVPAHTDPPFFTCQKAVSSKKKFKPKTLEKLQVIWIFRMHVQGTWLVSPHNFFKIYDSKNYLF